MAVYVRLPSIELFISSADNLGLRYTRHTCQESELHLGRMMLGISYRKPDPRESKALLIELV